MVETRTHVANAPDPTHTHVHQVDAPPPTENGVHVQDDEAGEEEVDGTTTAAGTAGSAPTAAAKKKKKKKKKAATTAAAGDAATNGQGEAATAVAEGASVNGNGNDSPYNDGEDAGVGEDGTAAPGEGPAKKKKKKKKKKAAGGAGGVATCPGGTGSKVAPARGVKGFTDSYVRCVFIPSIVSLPPVVMPSTVSSSSPVCVYVCLCLSSFYLVELELFQQGCRSCPALVWSP